MTKFVLFSYDGSGEYAIVASAEYRKLRNVNFQTEIQAVDLRAAREIARQMLAEIGIR